MNKFEHQVVICIVNNGFADEAMDAARDVGARGGTVLSARGTASCKAIVSASVRPGCRALFAAWESG